MLQKIGNKFCLFANINVQYMGLLRFNPSGCKKIENYIESLSSSDAAKLDMT